jgi:hypothetical protein
MLPVLPKLDGEGGTFHEVKLSRRPKNCDRRRYCGGFVGQRRGFGAAWRSGSFAADAAAGIATTAIAAVLDIGGTAALLAIWRTRDM